LRKTKKKKEIARNGAKKKWGKFQRSGKYLMGTRGFKNKQKGGEKIGGDENLWALIKNAGEKRKRKKTVEGEETPIETITKQRIIMKES